MPEETQTQTTETKTETKTETQANPIEAKLAEIDSKVKGLETWNNNLNQDVKTLREENERLRLEREQLAGRAALNQNQGQTILAEFDAEIIKAADEGDNAKSLKLIAAKSDYITKSANLLQATTTLNNLVRMAEQLPGMTPEAYQELLADIYADPKKRDAFNVDPVSFTYNPSAFDKAIKDAKKKAVGDRAIREKWQSPEETLSQHLAKEEEKKRIIESQATVTGGGMQTTISPAKSPAEEIKERLIYFGKVGRGEIAE